MFYETHCLQSSCKIFYNIGLNVYKYAFVFVVYRGGELLLKVIYGRSSRNSTWRCTCPSHMLWRNWSGIRVTKQMSNSATATVVVQESESHSIIYWTL